jgi:hypothetical protein
MSKRFLIVLALFFLVGVIASAQEGTVSAKEGIKINLSGKAEIDYVYSSAEAEWLLTGSNQSADYFQHRVEVGLEAKSTDKISFYGEIGNKRIDSVAADPKSNGRWGNHLLDPMIRQAYIKVDELFTPNLCLKIGLEDFSISDFFMNIRNSESPWVGGRVLCDPIGFDLRYSQNTDPTNPGITVDGFYAVVTEGGEKGDDETVFGVNVTVPLPASVGAQRTNVNVAVTNFNGPQKDQDIWTYGAGCNFLSAFNVAGLDLGAEVWFQSGDARTGVDAQGYAYRLDVTYTFQNVAIKPWVRGGYWFYRGDKTSSAKKDEGFYSYEGNNEFIIVENNYFGLDWDNNYSAIKFGAGLSYELPTAAKQVLNVSMLVGIFNMDQKVKAAPGISDKLASDNLGDEVDLNFSLAFTKDLNVYLAVAYLFGSDYMKDKRTCYPGVKKEDSAEAFAFGANLKF